MSLRRRCGWLLLAALIAPQAQAELLVEVVPSDLPAAEIEASNALVQLVAPRLPQGWTQRLTAPIQLQWRTDLPAQVHGRAIGNRIVLDRALLQAWSAQSDEARSDRNAAATRAAMAALIHELAHVLDRGAGSALSRDRRLRDLAGWQVRPWRLGRGANRFSDRSPDGYERRSPAEFVAVNLEHYVLDADYACRRPALAAWFAQRLGTPQGAVRCESALPYLQADNDAGAMSLLSLDPARVYAVDYLLAEGNEQPMSRWGHSMLRLVICAPDRAPGPACRLDLQYHRVLSFRAFVGDVQISSWRGLTGSYPSRLFVLPLNQVVDEYTKVELRALSSVPLTLAPDEIAALLKRAAQVHWSYDGRYYFISNNCAVETYKLLHDGVPRLAAANLSSITPRGLRRRLQRAGIADLHVLDDPAHAIRQGYYFESAAAHYQAMFDVLRRGIAVPQTTVAQWLDAAPEARAQWFDRGGLRETAAALLLEQAALRRKELLARDALKRLVQPGMAAREAVQGQLQALFARQAQLSHPAVLSGSTGYGLPQAEEQQRLSARVAQESAVLVDGWKQLQRAGRQQLPADVRNGLEQGEANVERLRAHLRVLARGDAAADNVQPDMRMPLQVQ
ncbi:DUF4105 domain-containing protein [Xanthomonas phaseoli]|uniref:Uncharacterized protein n=1 Tax=Xanthomonas phaseoli pv. dieffenbachiae TaxID=92828 RepID=A0A1V9HDH8_9XANT|nr:DUF4105 domain-containing protein [Xanthomonas phaseoli]MBO9790035.1 DUF4105 domain-containing protein [Xanthomonas phaseoli pv. dieffenbachiae]MBO9832952.1 DUF4105 domain-containing protein [Xanthomonas phaseoli pv. dieffenbachiae]MBO9835171.1 DUF4105 domain-containing protein [Xanthomonas phaseoli pv. dieffenbachiae]MBO9842348.1 DUF4105 domain-containing protein [Xanthomonas phaseoli pv. dieffenbachiae]MBO9860934.1 DUF4105 domain-containing protein [Xanthomonas phaseoli pv. dieffenbachiae